MAIKKLPSKLGDLIDLGRALEQKRLDRQREVEAELAAMKADEKIVDDAVQAAFEKAGMEKGSGSAATATLNKNPVPSVKDWDKVYAYILKTKEFDLLERRFGKAAYKERIERGEKIPGVETFWAKSISYSKFNGKS
jgi:hypothetical protein